MTVELAVDNTEEALEDAAAPAVLLEPEDVADAGVPVDAEVLGPALNDHHPEDEDLELYRHHHPDKVQVCRHCQGPKNPERWQWNQLK
jgi:hypothetical protein